MRIGLVSCIKLRTGHAAPARELYGRSALFRGALRYLQGRVDFTYVLSAKYGLIEVDEVVAPYNQSLTDARRTERLAWAKQVRDRLQERHGADLTGITFECHAGQAYLEELVLLLQRAGAVCELPLERLRMGERLALYGAAEPVRPVPQRRAPSPASAERNGGAVRANRVKIHVGVWLAAGLLHEQGHATFAARQLMEEIERRFGDRRPGVYTHVTAHCVANKRQNTATEYSYLFQTGSGEYRLYRQGDALDATRRGGRTAPDKADVPEQYWDVWRRWQ